MRRNYLVLLLLLSTFVVSIVAQNQPQFPQQQFPDQKNIQVENPSRILQGAVTCNVVGCETCSSNNFCSNCEDDHNTRIENGQCICQLFFQKPNRNGICEPCYIAGCASCYAGNDHYCYQCVDPNATISNGKCVCPAGQEHINEEGHCHTCDVVGCHRCSTNNNNQCAECIDSSAVLTNGQCDCQNAYKKPNSFGLCSYCLVDGCAQCTWSSYTCHRCEDSSATISNGKCVCPTSAPLNSDGVCQSCLVDGCESCSTGLQNTCEKCKNGFVMNTTTNTCYCPIGQRNLNDVCVNCQLHYCRECITGGGSQVCTMCQGDYLLSNGACVSCNIIGCKTCLNGSWCHTCEDPTATITNGQCECSGYYERPNTDGDCQNCYVPGCSSCQAAPDCFYSTDCVTCTDGSATLVDGSCYCPSGLYMSGDGHCTTCQVIGCRTCSSTDPTVCIDCIDDEYAVIENGKCQCKYNKKDDKDWFMPNFFGECGSCNVQGCSSCTLNASICYTCTDPNAALIDGVCVCPPDQPMNMEGMCQQCDQNFCQSCATGQPSVCDECIPSFTLANGTCVCQPGKRPLTSSYFWSPNNTNNTNSTICVPCSNSCIECYTDLNDMEVCTICQPGYVLIFGHCLPCTLVGCSQCLTMQSCAVCDDQLSTTLINGKCICNELLERPNVNGQCRFCFSPGCASCYDNDLNMCHECVDPAATVNNGVCYCHAGMYMNASGYCDTCKVPGCSKCSQTSNQICLQCIDGFNTTIIGDKCVCNSIYQKPNGFGQCSYCLAEGCASCLLNSYTCYRCIDPFAVLSNGKCSCYPGQSFNDEGLCVACTSAHIGCANCAYSAPHQCTSCLDTGSGDVHTLIDGQCVCGIHYYKSNQVNWQCTACYVPGCASCAGYYTSQETKACSVCLDPRATLTNSECVCPAGEYTFGGNQMCSTCRVPGCATCSSAHNDLCLACHTGDSTLSLVNGYCECSTPNYSPDHFGWCRMCNVPGCISCVSTVSNFCYVCKDTTAFVNAAGHCECPSGLSLDASGFCPPPVASAHNPYGNTNSMIVTKLPVGAIVGISIGAFAIVGLVIFLIFKRIRRKGEKSEGSESQSNKHAEVTVSHESTRRDNEFFMSKLNKDASMHSKMRNSEDSNVTMNKVTGF